MFCNACLNRKFDPNQGMICSLTGRIADFEGACASFKVDASVNTSPDDEVVLDRDQIRGKLSEDVFQRVRMEQSLPAAVLSGIMTAVVCASIWAAITVATGFQIGYMAVAMGAAVGFVMRQIGKGVDPIFGYFGAGIALFGCLLGNFLSIIGFVANVNQLGYVETFLSFDYSLLGLVMKETFSVMDVIFYALAISAGYRLAVRQITEKDIRDLRKDPTATRIR